MTEPTPIVLVPGLLCSPLLYANQIPALWQFGPVMVADHRRDDTMDGIARRILASAPPRFALAGLSMGGYISYAILRAAPERVTRLALLDTGSRADLPEQTERRKAQIELARAGRLSEIAETLWQVFVHKDRQGDASLKKIVLHMAQHTGADAFIRQQTAIISRPDSRSDLPKIKCPTLVLVGEGDQLTPPKLSEEIAGAIPNSRLVVIPDSGHLSTLERPDAVNTALVQWMGANA
jgi:pimeloyl-ACP methyl ester carboxylesterase